MLILPKARNRNLVIQEADKELLLYDLNINKAFCLNETCSVVYQSCDGKTTLAELKQKSEFPDEIIFLALDGLRKENLLEETELSDASFGKINRREAVRKLGFSSLFVLPVITSLVAPVAAAFQSTCIQDGQFAGNFSTSGPCGSQPGSFYEERCDTFFATRCCTGQVHYESCTTYPGNPPGSPPFQGIICNCGT